MAGLRTTILTGTLLLIGLRAAGMVAAARSPAPAAWTLILQLPASGPLQVERAGQALRGAAGPLVRRLRGGRGGIQAIRRVEAGTILVRARCLRDLQVAGHMLIVTVAPSPSQRLRIISLNRVPLSEDPSHRALIDLQMLAGDELHARAPFGVVDERGRTAVLFQ
jgi:hypothetical protein